MTELAVKLAPEQDWSQCRPVLLPDGTWSPVLDHVKIGVRAILANPYLFNTDEMGAMKTAQCIIGAQMLFQQGIIDKVLVIAPSSVFKDVWFDDEIGQLKLHLFTPSVIQLYHSKTRSWMWGVEPTTSDTPTLGWVIANYEFIRRKERLEPLLELVDDKTLLILDESSAVKSYRAATTQACMELRWKSVRHARTRAGRVILLNGTPIANNPMDLFSQSNLLHPNILDCSGVTKFRARYAEMGGFVVHTAWGSRSTQIVGWKRLDDLQRRLAPYVLRRMKKDCLDLPPVLPAVTLNATLSKETWKIYKEMRDEMVAWLQNSSVSVAPQTITKILRLSQITSGFIGGLEPEVYDPEAMQDGRPDWLDFNSPNDSAGAAVNNPDPGRDNVRNHPVQEIGREKLDVLLEFIEQRLEVDPNLKLLTWCRFIPELSRLFAELAVKFPQFQLGSIAGKSLLGKHKKDERMEALRLLHPQTAPEGPAAVGGTFGTGSLGLNLTACHTVVNMSFDYAYWKFVQGMARVDRPGQVNPVSTFDIVAVGPKGEKTVDHSIVRARRGKEDVAVMMTSAWWINALRDE
jgi:hypothetical protein